MAIRNLELTRRQLRDLAWLLDSSIPLPGLKYRIGLDAILGLIPGVGDAIGILLSSYIVREAARAGLPKSVLTRMIGNILVEGVFGMIPLVGDLFDAGWKANQRNVSLFNAYLENPRQQTAASRAFILILTILLVATLSAIAAVSFLVLRWVWQAISG